ncbi:MAG: ABC transporter permease subunit [Clostridia bacterium]
MNLIYALGGSKSHVMVKLLLPYNIPVIMNVLKVNIGLCLISVIIGEFLSARAGLGYLIIYGSQIFRMNWVILSILILCVLASSPVPATSLGWQ